MERHDDAPRSPLRRLPPSHRDHCGGGPAGLPLSAQPADGRGTAGGARHHRERRDSLWRAVDQDGFVPDVLVQSRRDTQAAKRLLRKLLKKQGRAPRVLITDKLTPTS